MAFGKKAVDVKYQVELAKELYRYQNFKSSVISNKVKSEAYQGSSIVAFHSLLRKYLANGKKDLQRATEAFYNAIDEAKAAYTSILRPSDEEAARPYTEHNFGGKGHKSSPVKIITPAKKSYDPNSNKIEISQDTMEKIKSRNTYLALKLEDSFMTFNNTDEMNGFLKACTQFGKNAEDFEKVKITVETL